MELIKNFTLIKDGGIFQAIKGSGLLYNLLTMGDSKLWEKTNNYRAGEEDNEED